MERLDKVLVSQNIGSRKDCAGMIRRGEVQVNGILVKKPETKINPESDQITVGGRSLRFRRFVYLMMNKPAGVLSATRDPRASTVLDLLPEELSVKGMFPAGRLDRDTDGLLLLTNDGDFAHRMLSPKKHVFKVYHAELDGPVGEEDIQAFREGVELEDMVCLPAGLELLDGQGIQVRVRICEGKFHQVKRMFQARGRRVVHLKRVRIGDLELDPALPAGGVRELTEEELSLIFR